MRMMKTALGMGVALSLGLLLGVSGAEARGGFGGGGFHGGFGGGGMAFFPHHMGGFGGGGMGWIRPGRICDAWKSRFQTIWDGCPWAAIRSNGMAPRQLPQFP